MSFSRSRREQGSFVKENLSTRAGLEAIDRKSNPRTYALWAASLLFVGGIIFGPLVQKFAFGTFWTGFPLGYDLTDNKTLIAMIGWISAVIAGRRRRPARAWVIGASILLLVVFLIPHSLLGSELDYSKMAATSTALNQAQGVFQVFVLNTFGLTSAQYVPGGDLRLTDTGFRFGFNIFRWF